MVEAARTLAIQANRYATSALGVGWELPVPVPGRLARRRPGRTATVVTAAGAAAVLAISGLAARYGGDVLQAVAGSAAAPATTSAPAPHPAPTAGSTGAHSDPVRPRAPGSTPYKGAEEPGSHGAVSEPATTGPPRPGTAPPGTTPPPASPPVNTAMISRLRAIVDAGRSAGEITADVAGQIDAAIDDIERRATRGLPLGNKAQNLRKRVERWVDEEAISPARGAELSAALSGIDSTLSSIGSTL
jgi:hypothetical protein